MIERRWKIGRYKLGIRAVDAFFRKGTGGEFDSAAESGMAEILIGKDTAWCETVEIILHELTELVYSDMRLRWRPAPDYSGDNGSYWSMFQHEQFAECTARVGHCMARLLPDAAKLYKKLK